MAQSDHDSVSNLALYQRLNQGDIKQLRTIFKSHEKQKFTINELENIFHQLKIHLSRDKIKLLFLKINTSRDDHCDWDEFVSHLIYEFQCDTNNQKESLSSPIVDKPIIRDSCHHFLIIRIRLNPIFLLDRTVNYTHGSYITVSKDGTINFWTQNFELQKTEISKNSNLKVAKTWILDLVCMPDVNIICTSSLEHDLRFYDTSGNNFLLKMVITNLSWAVSSMNYWFGKKANVHSKLILGDFGGNISLLEFNSEMRGPFRSKTGVSLDGTTWQALSEGIIPEFRLSVFLHKHKDIVRQVDYCEPLNCLVSAAECRTPVGRVASPGLVLTDLGVQKKETVMRMTGGVTCFAYESASEIFATGGPDTVLRIWKPNLPTKATAILHGHKFGITFVFFQDAGQLIYSIDCGKVVKIWSCETCESLQTYILVSTKLTDLNPTVHFYNDNTRELIFANMKIATVKCCPRLNLEKTDGYTHLKPVSVVLYNTLFKTIVSCGFDSCIIIWEPWTGKRQNLIKSAHTRMFYGEILNVEITAGCFDVRELYLLTGARNGTLKIWNLKDGICVRNLSIEYMCEVTAVFWLPQKILAVGWNQHIVEFPDTHENDVGGQSNWVTCHVDDIFSAALRVPEVIVTGSYVGGLIFWNLRTGQPYRKIEVTNPKMELKITYTNEKQSGSGKHSTKSRKSDTSFNFLHKYVIQNTSSVSGAALEQRKSSRSRRISVVQMPFQLQALRRETIHSIICLATRPSFPSVGNIFISLENGRIQVFSDHLSGGYIDSFNGIHMAGDCITSMTTDSENRYLITGTAMGYIKTWLVCNYCIQQANIVHINMPKLRSEFPFLIKSRWQGRAKRTVWHQMEPLLINSFRAHNNMSVTGFAYINKCKLLVSSSTDHSVRIWTLSGRYVGTLGSPLKWNRISSTEHLSETFNFRIPPDIKGIASSTTLQVLSGGQAPDLLQERIDVKRRLKIEKERNEQKEEDDSDVSRKKNIHIFGEPITASVSYDIEWAPPNNETRINLETNQPFLPPLNYQFDELISTPNIPKLATKWKEFDFLKHA